jgi:hypothetical protein
MDGHNASLYWNLNMQAKLRPGGLKTGMCPALSMPRSARPHQHNSSLRPATKLGIRWGRPWSHTLGFTRKSP